MTGIDDRAGRYLADFTDLSRRCRERGGRLAEFLQHDRVVALQWPDDVVEQWLYDHSDKNAFLVDYGHIDLSAVAWHGETLPVAELLTLPTGLSDGEVIDEYAADHDHWVERRRHLGVPQFWETDGTWMRPPLLIDQGLLGLGEGLQVIEGRTRMGVLRGRSRDGRHAAREHLVWVGRCSPR